MCSYSFIADHYSSKFQRGLDLSQWPASLPAVTKAEFDELKKQVQDMKELLEKAADYDRRTGQPDCEMEDKVAFLRKVAEFVGIPDAVKAQH
jgi:hypothetical protein